MGIGTRIRGPRAGIERTVAMFGVQTADPHRTPSGCASTRLPNERAPTGQGFESVAIAFPNRLAIRHVAARTA